MLGSLLALIVLAAGIQQADACTCFPSLLQDRVCENDTNTILFRGIVESATEYGDPDNGQNHYIMKKVKVFQDISGATPDAFLANSTSRNKRVILITNRGSSLCGMSLTVGTKMLIDGYFHPNDGTFSTLSCDETRRWPSTKEQSRQLKKLLKKPDCTCSIRDCNRYDAADDCLVPPHSVDECILPPYTTDPNCFITYRRCRRRRGACQWLGYPQDCPITLLQTPIEIDGPFFEEPSP